MSNTFKVAGLETVSRKVDVEISTEELISASISLVKLKCPQFNCSSYVSPDGFWYSFAYYDPHKRESVYEKSKKASKEEKEIAAHIHFIKSLARK